MLQTLNVKNFAIVENATVEFSDGLNMITGETGAGKSILVGALGLILGERAGKEIIRAGEEKCGVEAVFQLDAPDAANALLDELEVNRCEDGRLVIRRVVAAAGSGKILVNDSPATLQTLKRLGDILVDMHGPHEHQSLLSRNFQTDALDSFGGLMKLRSAYQEIYRRALDLEAKRKSLDCDDEQVALQIDTLSFQVKEIEEAALSEGDESALSEELSVVANARRILELAEIARNVLTEDERSAFNSLADAQSWLKELSDIFAEAAQWREDAKSIAIQIQELSESVNRRAQSVESDQDRLRWLEDRMALVQKLKRKYGPTVAATLEFLERSKAKLADLRERGARIAAIEADLAQARRELLLSGGKLSKERAKAAETLAKTVTNELRELGFPHGAFGVSLRQIEPGPRGMDEVEYGFAPNVGEPTRPLQAIASSGEISRVMLAIKTILAADDKIPVLAFDEIDANIGGEMGNAIGAKLLRVARNHQILCITHLPQVAVFGKTHFVVSKKVVDGRTRTGIRALSGEERAEEVARMLGGRDLTSLTLKHAREMLKRVKQPAQGAAIS